MFSPEDKVKVIKGRDDLIWVCSVEKQINCEGIISSIVSKELIFVTFENCNLAPLFFNTWHFKLDELELIQTQDIIKTSDCFYFSSCPKCKEQNWKEVYSDWAKTNIKKCSHCGWC